MTKNALPTTISPVYPQGTDPETWKTTEASGGGGTLIGRADWSLHGLVPPTIAGYESTTGWWSFNDGLTSIAKVDDYLELVYPTTTGEIYATGGLGFDLVDLQIPELYVDFYARMPSAQKGGFKFCKFFGSAGGGAPSEVANCTWGFIYGSAVMEVLAFGDGTTLQNDSNNVIFYDGSSPSLIGRSYGTAVVDTPVGSFTFDNNWHRFQMRMKYNTGTSSGNEVANGEFELLIDGVRRLLAVNVFNRNPANPRYFDKFTIGDWAQYAQGMTINYRDVNVSVGGWV